jgi:flagellar protein FliS
MTPLPYQAYTRAQVTTSTQGELMVLLYRGAVRFSAKARLQLAAKDLEGTHNSLIRAQEIVLQLIIGIKPSEDETVTNLTALNNYIYQLLYKANMEKSVGPIDEALAHLRQMLETWEQIVLGPRAAPDAASVVSFDRTC